MNPIHPTIEKVPLACLAELQMISQQTFFESFSAQNTAEDMDKYLAEKFNTEQLSTELTNPNSEFYFALIAKEVVGYLKVNFRNAHTELSDLEAMEIERIYVLKQYHGKNVGLLLYETAIRIAQEKKANYVWLGVWEKNPRAIRFYEKNGFIAFDQHTFVLGNDIQTDIMMKRSSSPVN